MKRKKYTPPWWVSPSWPLGENSLWWKGWSNGWQEAVVGGCSTTASLKTIVQAERCANQALHRGAETVEIVRRHKQGRKLYERVCVLTQEDKYE